MILFEDNHEKVDLCAELNTLDKYEKIPKEIPMYVKENINPAFEIRPYQIDAFARFSYYLNKKGLRNPTQVLFEMATGSGKTLVMVMCILELYKQGYRNFIFFVNTDTIIQKTKDNFLNTLSRKYLLADKIIFDFKQIFIEEVKNFENNNGDNICIHFTTIQGLHSNLNAVKENNISYESFKDQKIVLISDEAHHINAQTKKGMGKDDALDITSWETTIKRMFESNSENVMIEFTATADLTNKEIKVKYLDKLLFKYDLAKFRNDKYSKEVKMMQADMPTIDRAILAIVLSQYRKKVYNQYASNVDFIKPVILMKSKTIKESKDFEEEFYEKIKNLSVLDLQKLRQNSSLTLFQNIIFPYFDTKNITDENLVIEIQNDFAPIYCLSVNSKDDASDKQLAVNDLENPKNYYRVIFAVDKLNEGWDVLNLFDIVRLYETRDSKGSKPGKTTVAEAQLIGRGARYFPFQIDENQDKYKRKYDNELENPLRILEELHYHSKYDSRYISELQIALRNIGMLDEKEPIVVEQNLKTSFVETDIYKKWVVWVNKKRKRGEGEILNYQKPTIKLEYKNSINTYKTYERLAFDTKLELELQIDSKNFYFPKHNKEVPKGSAFFQPSIVRTAMQHIPFFHFSNLKKYYPYFNSWVDIFSILDGVEVNIKAPSSVFGKIHEKEYIPEQFRIVKEVLYDISCNIETTYGEYYGTTEFYPVPLRDVFKNKKLSFSKIDGEKGISMKSTKIKDLSTDLSLPHFDWYVYNECFGTSEEKFLIKFVEEQMPMLKEKYKVVYLIRNERDVKLHNFRDGKGFEPDFILLLSEDENQIPEVQYNFYIEPKGSHLIQNDKWKEDFLLEIKEKYTIFNSFENKNFKLFGLPFFNHEQQQKRKFIDEFKECIK